MFFLTWVGFEIKDVRRIFKRFMEGLLSWFFTFGILELVVTE